MATDYGTITYARRGGDVQRLVLQPGNITIGRASENMLVLNADAVADFHARLFCTPEGCWIMDLVDSFGTFLNTVRLPSGERRALRDGDMIRIGPFFLRYSRVSEQAGAPISPAPARSGVIDAPANAVLLPEIAANLPTRIPPANGGLAEGARRLRGNAGPPRLPPGARRLTDGMSNYMQYLPPGYQDDTFLGRFLLIFESVLDPLERMIDQIHLYFDPRFIPESLLPWLATWVDLVLNENWPADRRRELIRSATNLYRWRGTRRGMSEYIRIYTGVEPTIVEPGDPGQRRATAVPPHTFRVILEVPDTTGFDRHSLEAIIEAEKPAHTAYFLEIREQR